MPNPHPAASDDPGRDAPGPELSPDTRAVRSGRGDNGKALAPILWATTTFETDTVEEARRMATAPGAHRFYSRYGNPTIKGFEEAVADLEGAEAARAFASGMGAISAVVLGLCSAGSHIVAQRRMYAGTTLLLQSACPRFGIDVTFVDGHEPGAFAEAVEPGRTMLVIAETPANPRLDIVDLDEIGGLMGPIKVVDSTLATPLGQRPLDHGVDLVVHSATKAIAGHNDATLGVAAGSADLIGWLWSFAVLQGANASPFDAMNGLRGLRTLGVRLRHQTESALALARACQAHPAVSAVCHPGLESHPGHALAGRQMKLTGGLVTIDVAGGYDAAVRLTELIRVCRLATSLGGPETILTHPASTTHAGLTEQELAESGIAPGTIRISVGLEDPVDIEADVVSALDAVAAEIAAGTLTPAPAAERV
ncbi:MAG: PLP-dependent aspartate aminotransferase family protein [Actinomycetota bacterium]|nr:PLP-dependent aspartate aminotransferase family protein [Actinomycetota bacterium]